MNRYRLIERRYVCNYMSRTHIYPNNCWRMGLYYKNVWLAVCSLHRNPTTVLVLHWGTSRLSSGHPSRTISSTESEKEKYLSGRSHRQQHAADSRIYTPVTILKWTSLNRSFPWSTPWTSTVFLCRRNGFPALFSILSGRKTCRQPFSFDFPNHTFPNTENRVSLYSFDKQVNYWWLISKN